MSDPREDDEPISIEADAPEADWIEQHQPVGDEDEADAYTTGVGETDDAVSIEADTPEADWIEQHQPVVEAPDEERLPDDEVVEAGELEQDWIAPDEEFGAADDQELATPPVATGARGCNVLAAFVRAVLRLGCDAARPVQRRNQQPRD